MTLATQNNAAANIQCVFKADSWGSVTFLVLWCTDNPPPRPLQGQLRLIKSLPVGDTQRWCINNHSFIFQEGGNLLCWRPLACDWPIICLVPEPQGWLAGWHAVLHLHITPPFSLYFFSIQASYFNTNSPSRTAWIVLFASEFRLIPCIADSLAPSLKNK